MGSGGVNQMTKELQSLFPLSPGTVKKNKCILLYFTTLDHRSSGVLKCHSHVADNKAFSAVWPFSKTMPPHISKYRIIHNLIVF